MSADKEKYLEIQKWTKRRKYASIAMLLGFVAVVLGYFFINDMYAIIAIWLVTIIIPHATHTLASRKLKKLNAK